MNATEALHRKLQSIGKPSPGALSILDRLPLTVTQYAKGDEVVADGSISTNCCLLINGYMHRQKILREGGRQILAFHFPGDIPDLQSLHLPHMDHALVATSACEVAFIPHSSLADLVRNNGELGDLLWRDSLIDAAIFRTWIAVMGRLQALHRMAHLMCEIFDRLASVGLASGKTCALPLTQDQLADALGISLVHANRSLQELRDHKLLSFDGRTLAIENWTRLQELGEFDPTYLHLTRRPDFDPDNPIQ